VIVWGEKQEKTLIPHCIILNQKEYQNLMVNSILKTATKQRKKQLNKAA
jgi:hypothetical protein